MDLSSNICKEAEANNKVVGKIVEALNIEELNKGLQTIVTDLESIETERKKGINKGVAPEVNGLLVDILSLRDKAIKYAETPNGNQIKKLVLKLTLFDERIRNIVREAKNT